MVSKLDFGYKTIKSMQDFILNGNGVYAAVDTETNGFGSASVLSVSAIKFRITEEGLLVLDEFNRFYYPAEQYNNNAIKVNGLSKEVVDNKRSGYRYPSLYKDDKKLSEFFSDVGGFVFHNSSFDVRMLLQNPNLKIENIFCTMSSNTEVCKLTNSNSYKENYKMPKLSECSEFYGFEVEDSMLHGSEYDAFLCMSIFEKMFEICKDIDLEEMRRASFDN